MIRMKSSKTIKHNSKNYILKTFYHEKFLITEKCGLLKNSLHHEQVSGKATERVEGELQASGPAAGRVQPLMWDDH